MGHCKDCVFWGVHSSDPKVTVCKWYKSWGNKDTSDDFEAGADAADDTNLSCWIHTGPMFGCVHFEAKS